MTPKEECAMYDRDRIMARIEKMDVVIRGNEEISKEQADTLDKLIRGRLEALAISLSLDNQEGPFIAADDQREAYQKEFNCKVYFRVGIGEFFVDNIPN